MQFNQQQYVIDALSAQESWRLFRIMAELVEGFEDLNGLPPCVSIFGSARPKEDNPMYQQTMQVAKALGQALALRLGKEHPILCLDRVQVSTGSFLDVGAPIGPALPVVVKTLVLGDELRNQVK
jgi:ethanolamine utilization protein EutA (predicted chaperonin)